MLKQSLYLSAAALALIAASPGALAQNAPAPTQAAQAAAPQGGLEEIIVTAEKRDENLQKVPLAVTSISADLLKAQRVTDPQDLNDLVPNAVFQGIGAATGATISIRGIATSNSGPDQANGVAVHEDGAYLFYGLQPAEMYDLERVEVDPGPQGTVFGRAAAAGAVNIITNKPTFNAYEFDGEMETGTYSLVRPSVMVNVPLADNFAIRAAGQYESHDGYFSNGYNDADNYSGRIQALWQPTDNLKIRVGGDYLHVGGMGTCLVFPDGPQSIPAVGTKQSLVVPGNPWDQCKVPADSLDGQYYSVFGELNYDFGWGVLTVLPSYHDVDQNTLSQTLAPGGNTLDTISSLNQKEMEVRFNSEPSAKLQFVSGLFLYDSGGYDNLTVHFFTQIPGLGTVPLFDNPNIYPVLAEESYSVFSQGTYPILDWLKLTLGARYSYDESNNTGSIFYKAVPPLFVQLPGLASFQNSGHWWNLSWKASLEADLTDQNQIYATTGTGYKPGGLNGGAPPQPGFDGPQSQVVFGPEKIWHAEIGTKNRFLDNHLQINDSVFYDWYENYEVSYVGEVNPQGAGIYGFTSTNNGRANIYGNELTAIWLLNDSDRVDLSIDYYHGTFNSLHIPFYTAPVGIPSPAANYYGAQVPQTPHWSGILGYQHVFDFPDGSALTPRVSSQMRSSYFTQFTNGPGTKQGAYTRTTLNLTYDSPDDRWSINAYVKNVENSKVLALTGGGGGNAGNYPADVSYLDPLTAGVVLSVHLSIPRTPSPPVVSPPPPPPAINQPVQTEPQTEAQRSFQVFFDFDKSDITAAASQVIQAAADAVKQGHVVRISVTGHTDTVGTAKYNQALSERRAAAVKAGLVSDGVAGTEVSTTGVGKTGLLVPTADGVREPQNRRAEIVLQ